MDSAGQAGVINNAQARWGEARPQQRLLGRGGRAPGEGRGPSALSHPCLFPESACEQHSWEQSSARGLISRCVLTTQAAGNWLCGQWGPLQRSVSARWPRTACLPVPRGGAIVPLPISTGSLPTQLPRPSGRRPCRFLSRAVLFRRHECLHGGARPSPDCRGLSLCSPGRALVSSALREAGMAQHAAHFPESPALFAPLPVPQCCLTSLWPVSPVHAQDGALLTRAGLQGHPGPACPHCRSPQCPAEFCTDSRGEAGAWILRCPGGQHGRHC